MSGDLLNGAAAEDDDDRLRAEPRRVFMRANAASLTGRLDELDARYARDQKTLHERADGKLRFLKAETDSEAQALDERYRADRQALRDDITRANKIVYDNRPFPQAPAGPRKKRTRAEVAALRDKLFHICLQYEVGEVTTDKLGAMVDTNGPDVSKVRKVRAKEIAEVLAHAADLDRAWAEEKAQKQAALAIPPPPAPLLLAPPAPAPEPALDDDGLFAIDYGGL